MWFTGNTNTGWWYLNDWLALGSYFVSFLMVKYGNTEFSSVFSKFNNEDKFLLKNNYSVYLTIAGKQA